MLNRKRRSPWPLGDKLRTLFLEAFVKLLSFPMVAISMKDLVSPQRGCANCSSRLITTLDQARVHAQTPTGLAMEATPSLHRCLKCHELTAFLSAGLVDGVVVPFEEMDEWLEHVYPGMPRC